MDEETRIVAREKVSIIVRQFVTFGYKIRQNSRISPPPPKKKLKFVKIRKNLSGHFETMGPCDWLFWCSTATN